MSSTRLASSDEVTVEEVEEPQQTDYNSLTVTELKAIAKEKDIVGYSSMTKAILIEELEKLG